MATVNFPKCPVCGGGWHGLTGDDLNGRWQCPGEYGTDEQKSEWLRVYGFLTAFDDPEPDCSIVLGEN